MKSRLPARRKSTSRSSRGNSTIRIGTQLLSAIARLSGPATLRTIAEVTGLTPSTAYRYLRGLVQSRYIEQHEPSGRYTLGSEALHVGLAALGRIQPVREAMKILPDLTESTGLPSSISVWGSHGPTLLISEQGGIISSPRYREGMVQRLLTTATGQVFMTYMPPSATLPVLEEEIRAWKSSHSNQPVIPMPSIERIKKNVQSNGLAISGRAKDQNRANLAAPVFDHLGRLCVVISLVGAQGPVATLMKSELAEQLKNAAGTLSDRLGAPRNLDSAMEPAAPALHQKTPAPVD